MDSIKKKSILELTQDFFEKSDLEKGSVIDKQIALDLLSLRLFQAYDIGVANFNDANLYIINTNDDIDLLTKKSIFLPVSPTISFQNDKSIVQIDHQQGYDIETGETCEYQFFCHLPNREKSSDWFWSVQPLLKSGIIQYIPNIVIDEELSNGRRKIIDQKYTIKTKEYTVSSKQDYLRKLGINSMQIDIPYINDIPLSLLSEISYDETDSFNRFKSFFAKNINSIDFSKTKEIVDFELSLKEEADRIGRNILSEQNKIERKHIMNFIGTMTAIAITLIIFDDQQKLIECIMGLGSMGCGLKKFISDSSDYLIQKANLKNNDCWYLWLIKNSKNELNI